MAEHGEQRRRPSLLAYLIAAWVVVLAVAAGIMFRGGDSDVVSTSQRVVPAPSVSESPGSVKSPGVKPSPRPVLPVDPWCWKSRETAETARCQEKVRDATNFVARYQKHQGALAAKHTIVREGPTGSREANSLSRHGLLLCWMVKEPGVSLEKMVSAFTYAMHPHPYTLPKQSDGTDMTQFDAATQIHIDALQEICPSLLDDYERKGGPVVAELAG